ncbi:TetR/AcrR family transcriptional regulator C-terminal domain-containing protein [Nonomuraea sp. K274]|uniref:TetR/AcrR family transcriptional regulator C-terminal domain-containing protein n=1 Tax=Nonomuraea cypriaca TaxID=1187855 RepID=A0A931ALQ6_9ACTN|nr:TetR/AcrR family transcriptional regulator [Nonomuraea cypriaca]MBF8191282.1 TetR/AcrR family transcriptional regulator C-terminal domain-containing protein [Nonomuraea cypriaca]
MSAKQFSSVWLREPRKATSPGRSREEIVGAAMELLDQEGLSGLSMRKLGAKLSSGATSLYWYVANKDELLELAYDEIWAEMTLPDPEDSGWRDAASGLAHSMRQVMLRHPWSADLLGRMPALGPHALLIADKMRRMFKLAGFGGLEIDYAGATLTGYVFGMTLPEVAWNAAMADQDYDADEMRASVVKAAAQFPDILERIDMDTYDDPRAVREMCFDFGLVSVLDGLERRLVT